MFKLKEYKKEILLLIITLLIIFLISESLARVYYFGFENAFSSEIITSLAGSGLDKRSDNCEIIYELKPNIKIGVLDFKKMETNSQGLRDKEYSIEKPPGVYRVVVLGDSFTMPSGVDIDDVYHSILEERFNKSGQNIEFINFAVEGYHLGQYLTTLRDKAVKYNPDAVLIGFFVPNDVYWWTDTLSVCDYKPVTKKNHFFTSFFIKFIKTNSVNVYNRLTKKDEEASDKCDWVLPGVDRLTFTRLLQGFLDFSKETKIPIFWVLLPGLHYGDNSHPYHRGMINVLCKSAPNFMVIDTLPLTYKKYIEKYSKSGREIDKKHFFQEFWIYPSDAHPNEEANEIFADIIYEKMGEYSSNYSNAYQVCINQRNNYELYLETGKLRVGDYIETYSGCR